MLQTQPLPSDPNQHEEILGKKQQCIYGEHCRYQHCGTSSLADVTPLNIGARNTRSWQTVPCKHFIRTGHCPVGDSCNFIHDLSLEIVDPELPPQARINRHCWSHVQGRSCMRGCHYFHPYDVRPYKKYTPCYAWNLCPNQQSCPFRHPERIDFPSGGMAPSVHQFRGPMTPVVQTNVGYSAATSSLSISEFGHPTTEEPRTLNRGFHVPPSDDHNRGTCDIPPSYVNEHVCAAGHVNSRTPFEALPGPSFEDSPPQLISHRHHKIHNTNPNPWLLFQSIG